MQIGKKSKLIQKYLASMPAITQASANLMQTVTLERLRSAAPRKITQIELAKALDCNKSTISAWETGKHLEGIDYKDMLTMAELFKCRLEEVIAAIANTAEPDEPSQSTPPLEVVQR